MTIETWLESAKSDADHRGLPELKPLLEALAEATRVLRDADFNCYPAQPAAEPSKIQRP